MDAERGLTVPGTEVPERELPGPFSDAGSMGAAEIDEAAGQNQFADGKS